MRLIDAEELEREIKSKSQSLDDLWETMGILNTIRNTPTRSMAPEEAEWEEQRDKSKPLYGFSICSNCGDWTCDETKFCPECGRKMKNAR